MLRPTSVTVFGALNLFFSVLGLMVVVFTVLMLSLGPNAAFQPRENPVLELQQAPILATWNKLSTGLSGVACIALFASGIGLLNLRPWGRKLAVGYCVYAILAVIVALVMHGLFVAIPIFERYSGQQGSVAFGAKFGAVVGFFGGGLGMIYPLLLLYFMTRPRVVAAFGGGQPPGDFGDPGPAIVRPESGNPYVSPLAESSRLAAGGPPSDAESIVEAFVPSKNGAALASYYMGLFSLFPLLGFPLGVTAVVYGRRGLRNVRANPAVRGGAHAWVGIVCGSLFGLFNFLLLVLLVIGLIGAAMV